MFKSKLKMNITYEDRENKVVYSKGQEIFIESQELFLTLCPEYASILEIEKQTTFEHSNLIALYSDTINSVGGIETFLFNFSKRFKNKNIVIYTPCGESRQLMNLSKYAKIIIDRGQQIDCDIFIMNNYNNDKILNRVSSRKIYQVIHADISEANKRSGTIYKKHQRVNEVVAVSDTARNGLYKVEKIDSKVIYNVLDENYKEEKVLKIITLSRISAIKGIERVFKIAEQFRKHNYSFLWVLTGDDSLKRNPNIQYLLKKYPEIIVIPQSIYNKNLIEGFDYLAQLSDTESFCYSAYEALQRKVPVLITDYPEAFNTIVDGINGYIIKRDLSNLDVEKIFSNIPKVESFTIKESGDSWIELLK